MKFNITYELMSGDKIYYVTRDGNVKTIVLKPEHFDLVHDRLTYPITDSALFETDKQVFYLGSKTFKDTDTRIPLKSFSKVIDYNTKDRFEEAKDTLKNASVYDYVYPTLEQAQEIAKNKQIEDLKFEIISSIKFIVAVDAKTNIPITVYTNITSYSEYLNVLYKIQELTKEYLLITTVGLEDGRTFELGEFKLYVENQIGSLSSSIRKSQAKAREIDSGNEIVSHDEYDEQTQKTVNELLKHLRNVMNK